MEEENLSRRKHFRILHCFQGPVRDAFVYTYYQTYTQEVDMLSYILAERLEKYFLRSELSFLKTEKRPKQIHLPLIYQVLLHCCTPSLPAYDNPEWQDSVATQSVPNLLTILMTKYDNFLHGSSFLEDKEYDDLIADLKSNVQLLIEKAAAITRDKRGSEVTNTLTEMFVQIQDFTFLEKKSIGDVIHAELEYRYDRLETVLSQELSSVDSVSWCLERYKLHKESDGDDVTVEEDLSVEMQDLSLLLLKNPQKRLCIGGQHGIGKSVFAGLIVYFWHSKLDMGELKHFDILTVISASDCINKEGGISLLIALLFPLTVSVVEETKLITMLKEKNILLIIDDADALPDSALHWLTNNVKDFPRLHIIFIGSLLLCTKFATKYTDTGNIVLHGLKDEKLLSLSHQWTQKGGFLSIEPLLKANMNRFRCILKCIHFLKELGNIWNETPNFFSQVRTASDLLWALINWKCKHALNLDINYPDDKRKRFNQWMKLAGKWSLESLYAGTRISKDAISALKEEMIQLFPVNGEKFMSSLFKPAITHSPYTCYGSLSTHGNPILDFLGGWYIMHEIRKNKTLKEIVSHPVAMPTVIFATGHLQKAQDEGSISVADEKKMIKALIHYSDVSFEDFNFIFQFVAELKCIKRLIPLVVDETEYNEEWNLPGHDLQLDPLKTLLDHVSPVRLIFLIADNINDNNEIDSIMEYACRVKLSVWLESNSQFLYGNSLKMDALLKPFLAENTIPKLDLLAGSLSRSILKELPNAVATKHLVLLKLKVSSEKTLKTLLGLPKNLPKLLWLEIKIDMDISNIAITKIHATKVPLFDVHIRRIEMTNVGHVADFLMAMQLRFTGIHLEETAFSPEGVYTLLKELSKRRVSLSAEKEAINKFRRWYYPNISSIPRWKPLTEEQILDLIGYDDINFYSDHKVTSSRFVTALDAWNLKNYLENEKQIIHFCYEASNISFTKQLNGKVETNFKGDYWETIQESTRKMSMANADLNILESSPAFRDIYE